jgi:hypothetical protein
LAKLTPVLASAALYPLHQRRLRGTLAFIVVVLAGFVPAFLASAAGLSYVFSYHADRGLQIESFAASILFKLNWVEGIALEYRAWEASGELSEVVATITLLVTLALLSITGVVIWREARRRRLGPNQFPRYAAALFLAFMIGSKVLSPQYLVWLLPLVPLAFPGAWNLGVSPLFLLACWLTPQISSAFHGGNPMLTETLHTVYAEDLILDGQRYLSLVGEEPLYGMHPLDILLGRNVLLFVPWLAMLMVPAKGETEFPEAAE